MRFMEYQLLALVLGAASLWLLLMRSRLAAESNWPLVYYLATVIYMKAAGSFLPPEFVYSGVVCAMLIRFEFMAGWVTKAVRFLEFVCLLVIAWRCVEYGLLS